MLNILFNIVIFFSGFTAIDTIFTKLKLEGVYYGVHAIHNALITYATLPDVSRTLTQFSNISQFPTNMLALQLCFALHFYHIAFYWRKFRQNDWLHHVLMIGVALPIGGYINGGPLLGYSLFFTTGLPGGIDYCMLCLVRNGVFLKETEKRINTFLQVWIRSPGCVSHAALTVAYLYTLPYDVYLYYGVFITAFLNYWNGQYFMQQVVYDLGKRSIE